MAISKSAASVLANVSARFNKPQFTFVARHRYTLFIHECSLDLIHTAWNYAGCPLTGPIMLSKVKQPPRCSKCPNRPLRKHCMHTTAGKAYLANLGSLLPPPAPHIPSNQSLSQAETKTNQSLAWLDPSLAGASATQLHHIDSPIPQSPLAAQHESSTPPIPDSEISLLAQPHPIPGPEDPVSPPHCPQTGTGKKPRRATRKDTYHGHVKALRGAEQHSMLHHEQLEHCY